MMTQTEQIIEHLKSGKSITPIEALNLFGCFRLGARIWDIKAMGYDVETKLVHKGKKQWARYRLKTKPGWTKAIPLMINKSGQVCFA